MSIKHWPLEERPREKLLTQGAIALSDAELLAVCLGSGVRGQSAVDLGRDLLKSAGSLRALLSAEADTRLSGMGAAKVARLKAALELARRCLSEDLRRLPSLRDPAETSAFLHAQLGSQPVEIFACVFLDNRHRVIAFEELFRGTIDAAAVYPREVVRACLKHNAAAVILAHNHPSGESDPSEHDQSITSELSQALALINVCVLDHFIVGASGCISMVQRGLL